MTAFSTLRLRLRLSARSGFASACQHAPASPPLVSTLRLRLRLSARSGFASACQHAPASPPLVSTLRALQALACQQVSFPSAASPWRTGGPATLTAVGSTLMATVRDDLPEMLTSRRPEGGGVLTSWRSQRADKARSAVLTYNHSRATRGAGR